MVAQDPNAADNGALSTDLGESASRHDHGDGHEGGHGGHGHGVSADADRRWLAIALVLIVGFMAVEVVVGVLAHLLALISDTGQRQHLPRPTRFIGAFAVSRNML